MTPIQPATTDNAGRVEGLWNRHFLSVAWGRFRGPDNPQLVQPVGSLDTSLHMTGMSFSLMNVTVDCDVELGGSPAGG